MIHSFRHRGLKRLYQTGDKSGIRADPIDTVQNILAVRDAASTPHALELPRYRLHPLKGALKRYWAVTVGAKWRTLFTFRDGNAYDVELIDYH